MFSEKKNIDLVVLIVFARYLVGRDFECALPFNLELLKKVILDYVFFCNQIWSPLSDKSAHLLAKLYKIETFSGLRL